MAGEKTEKATPKRRKDQRKKGNISKSEDIISAAVLICMFGLMKLAGPIFLKNLTSGFIGFFNGIGDNNPVNVMKTWAYQAITIAVGIALPISIAGLAAGIVSTMAQTRLLVTPPRFDFSRISPINGFKNLFSLKSAVETLKSVLKIMVIALIIYDDVSTKFNKIMSVTGQSVTDSVAYSCGLIVDICLKSSVALLLIGVGDYFFQWWNYERNIMMSKDEIKEEFKQTEGNPEVKGRIRAEQRRLSHLRMMQAVPSADVVIRNPTHYAIALKYDRGKNKAPVCVAKGKNNVALKIVEIAEASNVHTTENKPLAQALYKTVEIGGEIPPEFYKAVAEVLAYIYRLKKAGRT